MYRKIVVCNYCVINCDFCYFWCYIKCGKVILIEYKRFFVIMSFLWFCLVCMMILQFFFFVDVFCLNLLIDSNDLVIFDVNIDDYYGCDIFVCKYFLKVKFGYINVNSMVGFKFYEIKQWFVKRNFDVLVIFEIKFDVIFLDVMFCVDGFRFI